MHQQIAGNVRGSWILVILTCLLLSVVGLVIGAATAAQMGTDAVKDGQILQSDAVRVGGSIGLLVAGIAAIVSALVSYFAGDRCVLLASRAKKIEKKDHPRLFNVVEEMAIAGGIPMPEVYIINDSAPNAFATGRKPETGKVAITTGLLSKLNRDELQGVMAHELSHIRNYDILFATMMGVLVGTIVLLCDAFWRGMRFGGRSRSSRRSGGGGGGAAAVLMIVALLLAAMAPLLAKLIQLAVSRKREYLADASAALLTRYPPGLASALQKISGDREVLEVANRATQHMYIVNPIKSFEERAKGLFSTHPDTRDRIRRLEEMGHVPAGSTALSAPAPRRMAEPKPAADNRPVGFGGLGRIFGDIDGGAAPIPPVPAPSAPAAASLVGDRPAPVTRAAAQPTRTSNACPRCRERLRTVPVGQHKVKGCKSCGGIWIGEGHCAELLRTHPKRLTALDGKFLNFIGHGWDRVATKVCPDCDDKPELRETKLAMAGGVPIDVCGGCRGVWYDDGELPIVVTAAQRAQRSS